MKRVGEPKSKRAFWDLLGETTSTRILEGILTKYDVRCVLDSNVSRVESEGGLCEKVTGASYSIKGW
jgi:hypothetical protein